MNWKKQNRYVKQGMMCVILFMTGAIAYVLMEIRFRGYSHWTMAILGGLCYMEIGYINEYIPWEVPLYKQALLGAVIVTINEFICGCIVNLWLGWEVWDYSGLPFNILGQVCLPFTLLWIPVSILAILVDDLQRYYLTGEEFPHYHIFSIPDNCKDNKLNENTKMMKQIYRNWKKKHSV